MKILIWHGYLLGGTGSNVYTRSLARAWSRHGHEVVVFCQDPDPENYDLGGARVVRPLIDTRLPVFVRDGYRGMQECLLQDMGAPERDRFVQQNVAAVQQELPADLLLTNHVLLGGPVGAGSGMPYVVKAHGSELEFSMRANPDLCEWARETLDPARAVLAGSEHIVQVLGDVVGPGAYAGRISVVPPGVDTGELAPRDRTEALSALVEQCRQDEPNPAEDHDPRRPDEGNADRLAEFLAGEQPTVLYVGKLSAEKGVRLLVDALARLRTEADIDARAVVVGFGPARPELEQAAGERVLFTGPLEHRHLRWLWPLADVSVTPSVFPEAFGMVAAEAASCGSPPLVARQSGLAEVAAALELEYPQGYRHLAGFTSGDGDDLTRKLAALLSLPRQEWRQISAAARRTAEKHWSWEHVASQIVSLGRQVTGSAS